MNYMGSKSKFTGEILPIILKERKDDQWYIEPFAGGMNMISEVTGNRIANDLHTPLIEMWKALVGGWKPDFYSQEEYQYIKQNQEEYSLHELGWVGFNCSYSGVYFSSYIGETMTEGGVFRNYQSEAMSNINKQVEKMTGVVFENKQYYDLIIPDNSIIYCDPPYKDTACYTVGAFDHDMFWEWVREQDRLGHTIFVSEYTAPDDFRSIWRKQVKTYIGRVPVDRVESLFKFGKYEWL